MDVFLSAHPPTFRASHALPSECLCTVLPGLAAVLQVFHIFFVDVLFFFVSMIPLGHQPLGDLRVHIQVYDGIRFRYGNFAIFEIKQPGEISVPLLARQLGTLMHRVGGV